MYAERCAAWDAKNRYGLPAEMPMEIGELAAMTKDGAKKRVARGLRRLSDALGTDD
jgi:hypothetical protein